MRPRRFPSANVVFSLPGGTEDNDLWCERSLCEGVAYIKSVWELTADERARIAAGENIELVVIGHVHPPVSVAVVDDPLGRDGDS